MLATQRKQGRNDKTLVKQLLNYTLYIPSLSRTSLVSLGECQS